MNMPDQKDNQNMPVQKNDQDMPVFSLPGGEDLVLGYPLHFSHFHGNI